MKLCKDCRHYDYDIDEFFLISFCRRLQNSHDNTIQGGYFYSGKTLDCRSEREIGLTFKEWIFGPNKNKCGRDGKFWEPKT